MPTSESGIERPDRRGLDFHFSVHQRINPLGDHPGVVKSGNHGKKDRGVECSFAGGHDGGAVVDQAEQDQPDGNHLADAVGFPQQSGAEIAKFDQGVDNRRGDGHSQVTSENDKSDVGGENAHGREKEKQGTEEQFVGCGIKILADEGALSKPACEKPIDCVCTRGEQKQTERKREVVLPDGSKEDGDGANS